MRRRVGPRQTTGKPSSPGISSTLCLGLVSNHTKRTGVSCVTNPWREFSTPSGSESGDNYRGHRYRFQRRVQPQPQGKTSCMPSFPTSCALSNEDLPLVAIVGTTVVPPASKKHEHHQSPDKKDGSRRNEWCRFKRTWDRCWLRTRWR